MYNKLKLTTLSAVLITGTILWSQTLYSAEEHVDENKNEQRTEKAINTAGKEHQDKTGASHEKNEKLTAHDEDDHDEGEHHDDEHHDEEGHDEEEHDEAEHHDEDDHGHSDGDSHEGEEHDDEHEDELELTDKQKKEIGLLIKKAGPGSLHSEVSLSGEIRLNEDTVTHIVPRIPGIAASIKHSVGDQVEAGEVLAVLESAELGEIKIEYFQNYKEKQFTETDLKRAKVIHDNTNALIDFLEKEPDLNDLREKSFGDMGEFRSRLILSYTDYLVARKAYERKKELFNEKIASENAFLETQNSYEKALAEYLTELDNVKFENRQNLFEKERLNQLAKLQEEGAEHRLQIFGLSSKEIDEIRHAKPDSHLQDSLTKALVLAPQAGTIIEKHINRGERVGEDADIFTIADLSSVWVDLKVPARDIHLIQRGMDIVLESPDGDKATAKITVSMPVMDEETRTATVRAIVDNSGGHWKPGSFVNGHVRISAEDLPIVIPQEALQNLEGRDIVFVADDHGFKARPVVKGRRDHSSVEIISGLKKSEPYVTKGAFELKAMAVTSNLGSHAGHGH